MLTKRQQQVLKAMVKHGALKKNSRGLWALTPGDENPTLKQVCDALDDDLVLYSVSASTLYALAHHGLVAFLDSYTVAPTPKGEALAALLDETTMVTRRGNGVVIS
jgi:hypothetical protein